MSNAVLANLPTYYMSIFQMPCLVVPELERILRNFFWKGHKGSKVNHLVKWKFVSKALKDGGLGLDNLKNRNTVLLFKWNWRFLKKQDSLWYKVVKSIHGINPYLWHTSYKHGLSLRSPWISISRTWSKFEAFTKLKIGDGKNFFLFFYLFRA